MDRIIRKYKFGRLLTEENKAADKKRIDMNQNILDKAAAYAAANPSANGAKFVKSLVTPEYNRKGKKSDGQEKGAQHVGDSDKNTTISFTDAKTTVSRFKKNQNALAGDTEDKKKFGMLVGDIKRKMDSVATATKSSVPQVPKVPKVPMVPKVKSASKAPSSPKVQKP